MGYTNEAVCVLRPQLQSGQGKDAFAAPREDFRILRDRSRRNRPARGLRQWRVLQYPLPSAL